MSLIVIMPGGFHPFHAGHAELYQSAKKAFPNAHFYVAATNDMSERPFPFALKEKLAKLSGVKQGEFVQVKSPFQPREITGQFNPEQDVVVFVRSEKDRNESPKPGGTTKSGKPAYFQQWTDKDLQPFAKHAYLTYLPTVEFGPGITSATEIRDAWPKLNDKRKLTLVLSLYPITKQKPDLAKKVVQMFDQVLTGQPVAESKSQVVDQSDDDFETDLEVQQLLRKAQQHYPQSQSKQQAFIKFAQRALKHSEEEDTMQDKEIAQLQKDVAQIKDVVNKIQVSESADYLEEK